MKRPFQVLVLGTGSHVGKSVITAGLCRILSDRGLSVAPFKAQNMALNSGVTPEGDEIGRAQLLQAQACRVLPTKAMNPVLLKPVRGQGSQVIVNGRPVGLMSTAKYFRYWPQAAKAAKSAWQLLAGQFDALVMEGAGSPAEVNLSHRDLANLETARFSQAPWILVVDIERGGSFAQVWGTLELIPRWLRKRLLGVVFNKFRGDVRLLTPGLKWLEKKARCKVLGVLPWLDQLGLDEEDSLGVPQGRPMKGKARTLKIEVLRLPFMSNFNDMLPLDLDPGLQVDWVQPGKRKAGAPDPDLVILPGSKDSLGDMEALHGSGEARHLARLLEKGCWMLGLCGGFQMLGTSMADPGGVDSGHRGWAVPGLGFLDLRTAMKARKIQTRSSAWARTSFGRFKLEGYQIHHGRTALGSGCKVLSKDEQGQALLVQGGAGGRVWGGYLHGLLDADEFRQAFLKRLAKARRKAYVPGPAYAGQKEKALDRLAAHLRQHLDLSWLPKAASR